MKPSVVVAGVVAVGVVGVLGWRLLGPDSHRPPRLSGYVEGETLYVGAANAGLVSAVAVQRGDRVEPGQPLFALDAVQLTAARDQAAAQAAIARAQLRDARKGQRPQELAVYDAERAAAEARVAEAQAEYRRVEPLVAKGVYARARLDQARAALDTARASAVAVGRRKDVGILGARPDALAAAEAAVAVAEQSLAAAQSRLDQISPRAPAAARVQDVFYQPGEWVAANQPVVALLADDRVRLRFFVPEAEINRYPVGTTVRFTCDGCRAPRAARINYVSPRAEFTPPVIYSREARQRLVFLVEARPEAGPPLAPGQPVDIITREAGR
ncbi:MULTISPECIES: HlyD family secretion protein [unclassified Caulobacter]|uniref:HlyD family secretion protein n=1 Tax=unclassified Caulobacter TaxID=2648921 RepID=UPI000785DB69|nr:MULTISPECIES: HlyD family efflux transporter periplasmic adaptor subunit [unclassified Caulobacter]AZS19632.1 HlyD family efflux transporter periplasmic adaptor subunit [Caulobacter sp. FWC26]